MSLDLDKSTWKRVAFGDVVKNVNVTVRNPAIAGIDRVIGMEHLDPGEMRISRWGNVEDGATFTRLVRPGQTLFGKRRVYQRKTVYADFAAVCSGDILVFEADAEQLLPQFLPFLAQCDRFYDHALGTSAGSLSPRTNWRDLATFEFDLPPLEEQQGIADLLWSVERHRQALTELRGQLLFSQIHLMDREVAGLVTRESIPFAAIWSRSPESGWSPAPVDEMTSRYVLSLAALGPDGYRYGHLKNVPDSAAVRGAVLTKGDFLISRANTVDTVGRVGIYPEDRDDVSFPDTMMRLSFKQQYAPEFVEVILASGHGRAHMRRTAAGSATSMVKINRKSLGVLRFPVVSEAEQQKVLNHVWAFRRADFEISAQCSALIALRRGLSIEIFGGGA